MIIGYVRISDDDDNASRSPERQRQQIIDHCATFYPALPVKLIEDIDVSGYTESKRPGWLHVQECLATGLVQGLVATDLSRLHRNAGEAIKWAQTWLVKRQLNLILLHERIDLRDAAGKMQFQIMASANEFHRNIVSDKVKRAFDHKRKNNEWIGGKVPYGYQVVERDGTKYLVADLLEQEAIALMLRLRLDGKHFDVIARELSVAGFQTKTGLTTWDTRVVSKIVRAQERKETR